MLWKPSTSSYHVGGLFFFFILDQKYQYTHVLWLLFSLCCHRKMMQSLGKSFSRCKRWCFEICYWLVLLLTVSYFSSEQMPVISTMSAMAVWTALTILRSELPLIQTSLKWIPVMTDRAQVPGPPSFCLCSPSIISPPLRSRHNRTCLSLLQTPKVSRRVIIFHCGSEKTSLPHFFSRFQSFLFFSSTH